MAKRTREERIRRRLFPHQTKYDVDSGGFVPLPIIMRRAQFLFTPRTWQVYCYILMRAGPTGIAWFSLREMSWDLDFRSLPKLKSHVAQLVEQGWICHEESQGTDYYFVVDPRVVLKGLSRRDDFPLERQDALDELQETLKQTPINFHEIEEPPTIAGETTPSPRMREALD